MKTGHIVKALRESSNLSLSAFSDLVKEAFQNVNAYENDRKTASIKKLEKYADAVGKKIEVKILIKDK